MEDQLHLLQQAQLNHYASLTITQIIENVFQQDSCHLNHVCLPLNRTRDKANRFAYESCQKVKRDPKVLRTTTNRLYNDIAFDILKSTWKTPHARKKVLLAEFVQKGYGCRRLSFARTTNAAEVFHKKLRGLLARKTHPPFEELINACRE
ncbi:unnamed protein product [Cylicocyclus nassatus]|uniref:Uncharacterized protein n=1 Tax=Cylicocyclus nassatus TaxID=53992 RepID=A0AA36GU43_CYLNA|nr:unnamed protein product [Cylicocyclus nassatus]